MAMTIDMTMAPALAPAMTVALDLAPAMVTATSKAMATFFYNLLKDLVVILAVIHSPTCPCQLDLSTFATLRSLYSLME